MRIERVKNFLTQAECDALSSWVDDGVQQKWLDAGISYNGAPYDPSKRVTSRFYGDRYKTPAFILEISERVRAYCGVDKHPLITGHGRDGIVISCTFKGGFTYCHKDGRGANGLATLRCNIVTRAPEAGCVLHVDNKPIDVEAGELHCYLVSEYEHYTTPVEGDTARIIFMFGAHVSAEDWNSGLIKVGN